MHIQCRFHYIEISYSTSFNGTQFKWHIFIQDLFYHAQKLNVAHVLSTACCQCIFWQEIHRARAKFFDDVRASSLDQELQPSLHPWELFWFCENMLFWVLCMSQPVTTRVFWITLDWIVNRLQYSTFYKEIYHWVTPSLLQSTLVPKRQRPKIYFACPFQKYDRSIYATCSHAHNNV